MRSRHACVLAIVALLACTATRSARADLDLSNPVFSGLTLYDGFNGTAVDTTKWLTDGGWAGGTVAVSGGNVTMNSNATGYYNITSKDQTAFADMSVLIGGNMVDQNVMGFGGNANGWISLRGDMGPLTGYVFGTNDGSANNLSDVLLPNTGLKAGDLVSFTWASGEASVFKNGTLLATSTANVPGALGLSPYSLGTGWKSRHRHL